MESGHFQGAGHLTEVKTIVRIILNPDYWPPIFLTVDSHVIS